MQGKLIEKSVLLYVDFWYDIIQDVTKTECATTSYLETKPQKLPVTTLLPVLEGKCTGEVLSQEQQVRTEQNHIHWD